MEISAVRDKDEFEALTDEWNALVERATTDAPFLRHEYLCAWWDTLGGGEWAHGDLWVLLGKEGDNLRAAAPLFMTTHENRASLMLLGSYEISDYLDLVAPAESLAPFVERLFDWLQGDTAPAWEALDLYNIPEASPTLQVVQAEAERRGWHVSRERLQPCPVVRLEGDWEAYLARLKKKQRHELRRKMRRAANSEHSVTWRIVGPGEDILAHTETFMGLMAYDEVKAGFLTGVMRSAMRRFILAAFENGWLQLVFLDVDGEPAAALLNFDYRNRIWVYNSGLNPKYLFLSPGWVLLGHLLQWAIEHGRSEVDFMRGDEDYKYRFGGENTHIYRLTVLKT